jgi:HAD superfamily hydrolase (TIGR01459 family)
MKLLSGIKEISQNYNYFIFDVWGVLHDGSKTYPNVVETLSFLKENGKKVCMLSNAPRRSSKVAAVLNRLGVTSNLYDFILTSGEATFLDLEKNQNNHFKTFGQKYFYIGPDKDLDLLEGLNYKRVSDASLADFLVNTGFENEDSTISEKMPHIIEGKKHNLPMICVNPDLIVVNQAGKEMICAGALAREYEKMSGKVYYYGKPFDAVYKMTLEKFGNPSKSEAITIGDGIETDIAGANNFGIDNILVTGGILANQLEIKFNQDPNLERLKKICDSYQIFPKFVISNLKLS